jgi:hypothetical protein
VRRWILTFASLAVIVLWLVLAYVPAAPRPAIGWPAWSIPALAVLAAGGLLAFLLIQTWLVRDTSRFLSGHIPPAQVEIQAEFALDKNREIFWTATPIAMTLALAALSFPLWRSLFG